ncbi:hypothetical protein J4421_03110 [Candidatus Woesearchaeota archaeon]|nr:hypothetical protein [Candidatus Woesearchaeota archaeon]
MKKQLATLFVLLLLVMNIFAIAQSDTEEECGFWCKVKEFLFGREEAVAGKAASPPLSKGNFCLAAEFSDSQCDAEFVEYAKDPVAYMKGRYATPEIPNPLSQQQAPQPRSPARSNQVQSEFNKLVDDSVQEKRSVIIYKDGDRLLAYSKGSAYEIKEDGELKLVPLREISGKPALLKFNHDHLTFEGLGGAGRLEIEYATRRIKSLGNVIAPSRSPPPEPDVSSDRALIPTVTESDQKESPAPYSTLAQVLDKGGKTGGNIEIARDADGNLFVVNNNQNTVYKIQPDGSLILTRETVGNIQSLDKVATLGNNDFQGGWILHKDVPDNVVNQFRSGRLLVSDQPIPDLPLNRLQDLVYFGGEGKRNLIARQGGGILRVLDVEAGKIYNVNQEGKLELSANQDVAGFDALPEIGRYNPDVAAEWQVEFDTAKGVTEILERTAAVVKKPSGEFVGPPKPRRQVVPGGATAAEPPALAPRTLQQFIESPDTRGDTVEAYGSGDKIRLIQKDAGTGKETVFELKKDGTVDPVNLDPAALRKTFPKVANLEQNPGFGNRWNIAQGVALSLADQLQPSAPANIPSAPSVTPSDSSRPRFTGTGTEGESEGPASRSLAELLRAADREKGKGNLDVIQNTEGQLFVVNRDTGQVYSLDQNNNAVPLSDEESRNPLVKDLPKVAIYNPYSSSQKLVIAPGTSGSIQQQLGATTTETVPTELKAFKSGYPADLRCQNLNCYVVDREYNRVYKVNTGGALEDVTGTILPSQVEKEYKITGTYQPNLPTPWFRYDNLGDHKALFGVDLKLVGIEQRITQAANLANGETQMEKDIAIIRLREVLDDLDKDDPRFFEAEFELAKILEQEGRYEEAKELYSKASMSVPLGEKIGTAATDGYIRTSETLDLERSQAERKILGSVLKDAKLAALQTKLSIGATQIIRNEDSKVTGIKETEPIQFTLRAPTKDDEEGVDAVYESGTGENKIKISVNENGEVLYTSAEGALAKVDTQLLIAQFYTSRGENHRAANVYRQLLETDADDIVKSQAAQGLISTKQIKVPQISQTEVNEISIDGLQQARDSVNNYIDVVKGAELALDQEQQTLHRLVAESTREGISDEEKRVLRERIEEQRSKVQEKESDLRTFSGSLRDYQADVQEFEKEQQQEIVKRTAAAEKTAATLNNEESSITRDLPNIRDNQYLQSLNLPPASLDTLKGYNRLRTDVDATSNFIKLVGEEYTAAIIKFGEDHPLTNSVKLRLDSLREEREGKIKKLKELFNIPELKPLLTNPNIVRPSDASLLQKAPVTIEGKTIDSSSDFLIAQRGIQQVEQEIDAKRTDAAQLRERAKAAREKGDEAGAKALESAAAQVESNVDQQINNLRAQLQQSNQPGAKNYLDSKAVILSDLRKGYISHSQASQRFADLAQQQEAIVANNIPARDAFNAHSGATVLVQERQKEVERLASLNSNFKGNKNSKEYKELKAKITKANADLQSARDAEYAQRVRLVEACQAQQGGECSAEEAQAFGEEIDKLDQVSKENREREDRAFYQSTWLDELINPGFETDESGQVKIDKKTGQPIQKTNWYSTAREYTTYAGAFASQLGKLGQFQALSNLLFPEATQNFIDFANSEFLTRWADLPSFAVEAICKEDDKKRSEIPGSATTFVETKSGTYQFVGTIQAEKNPRRTPILCVQNPLEEAREEKPFVCADQVLVCKEDGFCYESETAKEPAMGIFYKLTWGVTAPQDEKQTPFIDENNASVKFNIELRGSNGNKFIYEFFDPDKGTTRTGKEVIQLTNGQSDRATKVAFLRDDYQQACITFANNGFVIDRYGSEIKEICADFVATTRGYVEFSKSDKNTASTVSSSPQIRSTIG